MKRLFALVLVLLFVVACGNTADEPAVDANGTTITVYRSPT